ncbi:MAG: LysM peptidoglycan-binding domain-containing protein, partial [Anaerolineaceae bacterium]|nr:LysM peptidoglycan-binding domain-containing protein [Anaerolineaceae bacterium]
TNGRPWSLFPPGTYSVYHFDQPLGQFDFHKWPLYPGDFFYTYSVKDGFDHMFVITEVDAQGNVYSVTNLVQQSPVKKVTIERALLLNLNDPVPGLIHNEWLDRAKGRTGQAGFDVFRWDWMVKDILKQDALHVVLPGDTLGLVSMRWKTPADWIAQYNQLDIGFSLSVGQELRIPPNEDR